MVLNARPVNLQAMLRRYLSVFPAVLVISILMDESALAQYSTPPATAAELEQIYNVSIEKRTSNIVAQLAFSDPTRSTKVHDTIMAQYRALRARDQAIDTMFKELAKDAPGVESNRVVLLPLLSKSLHERFLAKLSAELTPEQIETVKDQMTYNKVKVTYDAYCQIISGLTEKEKAMILQELKLAREEAIDGGSASEKAVIFQKYKDQINAALAAGGHDVAKAFRDWEAKEALIRKTAEAGNLQVTP
jgi:hypothetical protein